MRLKADETSKDAQKIIELYEQNYKSKAINEDTVVDDNPNKEYIPSDKEMILIKERRITELEESNKMLSKHIDVLSSRLDRYDRMCVGNNGVCAVQVGMRVRHTEDGNWDKIGRIATVVNIDFEKDNVLTSDKQNHSIKGFLDKIDSGRYEVIHYPIPLPENSLQPAPNKEQDKPVLFTTEDGVEIKEVDDIVLHHVSPNFDLSWSGSRYLAKQDRSGFKIFYTKEAAEQYILENKPCLSLEDVLKLVRTVSEATSGHDNKSYLNTRLRELVKEKLKQ